MNKMTSSQSDRGRQHHPDQITDQVFWPALLQLGFVHLDQRTVMAKRSSRGPLRVLKPLYPEQDVCHVYILHPPGGVAGGDEIVVEVDVGVKAHTLITTPAAGKFYRSAGLPAYQRQILNVAHDGVLEFMPQETLLFGSSNVKSRTEVRLENGAHFIGMELYGLGRPASGDYYENARFENTVSLIRDSQPLSTERLLMEADDQILYAPWGLGGKKVFGTLYATPAREVDLERLRKSLTEFDQKVWAVTCIDDLLIVRYLGDRIEQGLQVLRKAWQDIRPIVVGKKACPPRIWNT